MTLGKHGSRTKRRRNRQPIFISLAAAVLLIGGILLYPVLFDTVTPPPDNDEQEDSQTSATEENKEITEKEKESDEAPALPDEEEMDENGQENEAFTIREIGTRTDTIELEGMEESTTVYEFEMEPYGMTYDIDQFLNGSYTIEENAVTYYPEYESVASVRLSVREYANVDAVSDELEQQFIAAYEEVFDREELVEGVYPYSGWRQAALQPVEDGPLPVGYYVLQVDDHVLLIEYEHIAEASDGLGPRLQMLVESIQK